MALMLACLLALAAEGGGEPVAMVLRSGDGATVQRGKEEAKPLRDMDLLREGDVVSAAKEAVSLVFLDDGHGERILAGKKVTVGTKTAAPADAVEQVERKISAANLKNLRRLVRSRGGVAVMRRGKDRDGLPGAVSPIPGGYVLTHRPEFSWPEVKGAVKYTVRLYDSRDEDRKLQWKREPETTKPMLAYPAGEEELPAGAIRYWEVVAVMKDGDKRVVVSNCQVIVATKAELAALADFAPLARSKEVDDWMLAASLYEARDAYDMALSLYKKADKARPDQPNILEGMWRMLTLAGDRDQAAQLKKRLAKMGVEVEVKEK